MKKNKMAGITLIALVVTIVVLLILAGITIQVVLQGGIIGQANRASESYKIADLRDRIDVIRIAWIADKTIDPSLPLTDLWDRLIKADIIETYDDVEGPEKDESGNDVYLLNTKDGYTVEIIVNDKG
ncbi:MAG: hypothetical protein HFJ28_07415, partial [Clostridia bacterium]|nr:hypothetical protein [Clostridia bacterium]